MDFLFKLYGRWSLWHSTAPSFRTPDCVNIYLYPNERIEMCVFHSLGPLLLQDRQIGNFSLYNDNSGDDQVHVSFFHGERQILSVFGIGLESVQVCLPLFMDEYSRQMNLKLDIVGPDDLFLTSRFHSHHLIRSTKQTEPSINVPFSTLVATHLTGMFISFLVKKLLFSLMHIQNIHL